MVIFYYNHKNLKYPIHVTDETLIVSPGTFNKNGQMYEEESVNYFYDNIPTDKSVNIVDIGAQTGLYTLYAKYLPKSQFYAFEPFPRSYKVLRDNITLNHIPNVLIRKIGISNYAGETILNTSKSHNGLHTLGKNIIRFNDPEPITIYVEPLDTIFYDNNIPVDFIKIDTEGWEYFILQGGEKTIQKYKPMIQLEWNNDNMKQCNVNVSEFIAYIDTIGYKKRNMIGDNLIIVPK
jgi:FkbM family methyltransferase